MADKLNVLVVEDAEVDAILLLRELARGGFDVAHQRVETASELVEALTGKAWDLVIADHALPDFTGFEALQLVRQRAGDVPFFLVSGTVGEETAVEALKAGANDYLFKGNLRRLCPAVNRELREVEVRREARRLETQLLAERNSAENALRHAHDHLAAANKTKDRFLAVLSHELRTPLTPVLILVSQLQTQMDLSDELRDDLRTIRQNIELEAKLIDELLDLTRIVQDKVNLHFEIVDSHRLVRDVLEMFMNQFDSKPINLTFSLAAQRSLVWADPARYRQVLVNLLSNALKFTPAGGHIHVRSELEGDRFRLQVIDDGIGIDAAFLPRIFDAFEQDARAGSTRLGGLGLGLSIARSLVEMQMGSLKAESDGLGEGAVLTVEFPALPPANKSNVPRSSGETDHAMPNHNGHMTHAPLCDPPAECRVLLVEDHADTRRILVRLLKAAGFIAIPAGSVREAFEVAKTQPFDLLISDIGLPDGNGTEIMRHFGRTLGIRGIAISGFGQEEDLRRSREAGFESHLTKPVDFKILHDTLVRLAAMVHATS